MKWLPLLQHPWDRNADGIGRDRLADALAAVCVFAVTSPVCVGIALATGTPPIAGIVSGIVGGVLVGLLSRSQSSIAGPAAGLQAVIVAQLAILGSFEALLLAVVVAGVFQIVLGLFRAGALAAFLPISVIRGMLAAIGLVLILKQIPHVLGHDTDPEGEMSFQQPDHENTFSEYLALMDDIHPGAAVIGTTSIILLLLWDRWLAGTRYRLPAPLVVLPLGIVAGQVFNVFGEPWQILSNHLVNFPITESLAELGSQLVTPDFGQWRNPEIYSSGATIAVVASLETLLNLRAVDKLDPQQRRSPPNSELFAQGAGNVVCGLFGGLPLTAAVVPGSIGLENGGRTRWVAVGQGVLQAGGLILFPAALDMLPMASIGAVLVVTGLRLCGLGVLWRMWKEDSTQSIPFVATLVGIVLSDLLVGTLIGLAVSLAFILNSNLRRPVRRCVERHLDTDVLHVELANQVSFLNRATIEQVLRSVPRGGHILLDASNTDYIDADILSLFREYRDRTAPAHGVRVSLRGFSGRLGLDDEIHFVEYATHELQKRVTPEEVLAILLEGNHRFRTGQRLARDLGRQINATALGQHPMAVVLSCIDSRTPTELIFDLGLGDIFSIRVAGNVTSPKVLGSIEYACAVAGARLVLVVGHTRCGAVTAAVELSSTCGGIEQATGCQHLETIVHDIQESCSLEACEPLTSMSDAERRVFVDHVARQNVVHSVKQILTESRTVRRLVDESRVAVVGAMYDVATGEIEVLDRSIAAAAFVTFSN